MSSGEVFAHYLFLGKVSNDGKRADVTPTPSGGGLRPSESTKTPNKEDFLEVMGDWFSKLIQIGHAADVMNCMETAIEVFYEWKEDILKCSADLFLRNENFDMALILNKKIASECLIDDLNLVEDIEQICNKCIPRWHFRMLNDMKRNQFFFAAIEKAIINGYKDVVDIGCGTGILSLFAAGSGADNVIGFEVSQTMCEIGNWVIGANGFQRKISLFNEISTNITSKDKGRRSELAVMEIFDSGLFGEGVLTTLQHAWRELLVHSKLTDNHSQGITKSRVIPSGAKIYVLLIESEEIRKHARSKSRVLDINLNSVLVLGKRDPEDTSEQPYTTENLQYIKRGYKPLSNPVKLLEVDFNNPQELSRLPANSFSASIPLNETGMVDGIVLWFELQLDEDLILSTSPDSGSCWEQAIYPIENRHHEDFSGIMAIEGSVVELNAFCNQQYLQIFTTNVHSNSCQVSKDIVSSATEAIVSKTLHDCKLNLAELPKPDNRRSTERFMCEEVCNKSDIVYGRCTKFSKDINQTDRYLNDKLGDVSAEHLTDPSNEASEVKSMEDLQFDSNKDHVHCHCSLRPELSNSSRTRIDACGILVGGKACTDNRSKDEAGSNASDVKCISVDRRKVARLNDDIYWHHYRNSISVAMKNKMKANENAEIKILCLSGDLSLIPLLIPITENASIDVPIRSLEAMILLENAAEENRIELHRHNFLDHSLPEIAEFGKEYDLVIMEIVEENGLLSQRLFDDVVLIRTFLLKKDGILIPEKFSVHGCILDSPMIEKDNFVNGNETTLGYEIGEFINQYRVFTHPDVDLMNLPCTRLTSDFEIIQVDLTKGITDEDILLLKRPRTVCHDILVALNGKTSAVGYWFNISLHGNIVLSTAAGLETHWHQSCAIFKEQKLIKSGKQVSLKVVMNRGNLHIVGIDDT